LTLVFTGGLLAYKFDIPTEILSGGEHSLEMHFALVNYQLLQLRNAFALAQTLNRTLVSRPIRARCFERRQSAVQNVEILIQNLLCRTELSAAAAAKGLCPVALNARR
jgi:hypothetical protein